MARLLFALVLLPALALAQTADGPTAAEVFGNGKPVQFKSSELDHRFGRSQIGRALETGTEDPNCAQVLGGLLTLLAETAPTLHNRDENFTVEPNYVQALQTQLTTRGFPANMFLGAMVRRVMLDRKLPDGWLATAKKLDPQGLRIDLARLKFLADGVHPIDSMYFTFPYLLQRHKVEVERANSAAAATAMRAFRETYLDHRVTWSGTPGAALTVVDIEQAPVEKRSKKDADDDASYDEAPAPGLVAKLEIRPPDPTANQPAAFFFKHKKPKPWRFTVRLKPNQYLDLTRLPKGAHVVVSGRLYDFNDKMTEFELRDAVLFEDHSAKNAVIASPGAVAACPMAIDELNGVAPRQPGGFGSH
jgi:hypothetical protein